MQIKHERIIPAVGYPYGAITRADDTYRGIDGNVYAYLGDRVFNVHPYCGYIPGYGIRWELDDRQKATLKREWELCSFD